jgi:hypothetical protein
MNGRRYAMPILPVMLIGLCISAGSLFLLAQSYIKKKNVKFSYIAAALFLALLSIHNYNNWQTIRKNWSKEDVRSALRLWLSETDGADEMYIYYAATSVFSFYAENLGLDYGKEIIDIWGFNGTNIDPAATQYKNYHYGELMRGKDAEYVKNSIRQSFSDNLPDSLWFMLSHIHPDNQIYMQAFSELGYGYEVYRWNDARLLRLYNTSYLTANYSEITDNNKVLSEYISGVDQIKQSLNTDNTILFQSEGNDPKIYITLPHDLSYDDTKTHKALIEFTAEHAGNLQLLCKDNEHTDFVAENAVNAQYVAGHNRVLMKLPENARLENLRLDFDNANVQANDEDNMILSKIVIYEEK